MNISIPRRAIQIHHKKKIHHLGSVWKELKWKENKLKEKKNILNNIFSFVWLKKNEKKSRNNFFLLLFFQFKFQFFFLFFFPSLPNIGLKLPKKKKRHSQKIYANPCKLLKVLHEVFELRLKVTITFLYNYLV